MGMILECACGKLYRVRDASSAAGSRCPACNGELRPSESVPDSRRYELESRARQLERDLERERDERRRLEESHARVLADRQKTIEALEASLASYRERLQELENRLESAEARRLAELDALQVRAREQEEKNRAALERLSETHQRSLAELRAELERRIAEKDRAISESRQQLDREAAERRRLAETLSRLQEAADRAVREKDAALSALQATLETYREKAEELQKRLDDLERRHRMQLESAAARGRAAEGLWARLDGAERLAADLDPSLDAMETLVQGLRERVRRLRDGLRVPAEAAPPPEPKLAEALLPDRARELSFPKGESRPSAPPSAPAEEDDAVPLISPPE